MKREKCIFGAPLCVGLFILAACPDDSDDLDPAGMAMGDVDAGPPVGSPSADVTPPAVIGTRLTFRPPPELPVEQLERAGRGTTVRVKLSFSEPVVRAGGPLRLDAVGSEGLLVDFGPELDAPERPTGAACFEAVIGDGWEAGRYGFRIRLADRAGNEAVVDVDEPGLEVDLDAGRLVIDPEAISWVRAPLKDPEPEVLGARGGYAIPSGDRFFGLGPLDPLSPEPAVRAGAFRLEPAAEAPRALRLWADAAGTQPLGAVLPNADGDWPRSMMEFEAADGPTVWLSAFDGAGNESALAPVERVVFVAASGPGQGLASPHDLALINRAEVRSVGRTMVEDRSALASRDGDAVGAQSLPSWSRTFGTLGPREHPAMAYDSDGERVLLFGGRSLEVTSLDDRLDDFWIWDGSTWTEVPRVEPWPPGRTEHDMAWDSRRQRLVLFGGFNGADYLNDTWEWDGRTWTRVEAEGQVPFARRLHRMLFDPEQERVLMFGGFDFSSVSMAVWAWDGVRWTRSPVEGAEPPARIEFDVAYDPEGRRTLLFGGIVDPSTPADLWSWDGERWQALNPSGTGPDERTGARMVYDERLEALVVTGGRVVGRGTTSEAWSFDGVEWSRLRPGVGPSRTNHGLVYDRARGSSLLFGGRPSSSSAIDAGGQWTWRLQTRPETWARADEELDGPGPRTRPAMVRDRARGYTLLFGGLGPSGLKLDDTWIWDGTSWTTGVATGEPPLQSNVFGLVLGLVYDEARQVPLLAGHRGTWTWTGSMWLDRTPAGGMPMAFAARQTELVYDTANERVLALLVDGFADTLLFEWDGSAWRELIVQGPLPTPRDNAAAAFDPVRERLVLYGGEDRSDTWEFDGAGWQDVTPNTASPGPRTGHSMVWDPRCRCVVLTGGQPPSRINVQTEIWEWDGADWARRLTSGDGPRRASRAGVVYDELQDTLVRFGGEDAEPSGELWELLPPGRPAVELSYRLPSDIPIDAIDELRLRAWCGGDGGEAGADDDGAELRIRQMDGAWRSIDENRLGRGLSGEPQEGMDVTLSNVGGLVQSDGVVRVQCRARAPSTASPGAEVFADYLELRVGYGQRFD